MSKVWIRVHPSHYMVGRMIGGYEEVKAGDYYVRKNEDQRGEYWYYTDDEDCPINFRAGDEGIEELNTSSKDAPVTLNEDVW